MDDAIFKGVTYTSNYLKKALSTHCIETHSKHETTEPSAKSKEARDFVDYCFNSVDGGLFPFYNNLLTYVKNGTSIIHKSYTKVTKGKYTGKLRIKRLSPRAVRSVNKWLFDKDQVLTGFEQDNFYRDPAKRNTTPDLVQYTEIPASKIMVFAHNATLGNPFGRSVLDSVWTLWKEKKAISNYQNIGISKNLSGVLKIEVPSEDLAAAATDPTGAVAQSIKILSKNAALSHRGENTFLMLPSDTFDAGSIKKYNATLMGVEGGTSNIDLSNILNTKNKDILDCFGCGFITLGNDGGGSFSLAETKTNAFAILLQEHLFFIEDVINRELIPQLLAMNGFHLEQEDMPIFKAGDIEGISLDEVGKYMQRVAAVGILSKDQDLDAYARAQLPKAPKPAYDKPLPENVVDETSRSGDGMSSGMNNGVGKINGSSGDTSTANVENN
jgi:hypothetical protein